MLLVFLHAHSLALPSAPVRVHYQVLSIAIDLAITRIGNVIGRTSIIVLGGLDPFVTIRPVKRRLELRFSNLTLVDR